MEMKKRLQKLRCRCGFGLEAWEAWEPLTIVSSDGDVREPWEPPARLRFPVYVPIRVSESEFQNEPIFFLLSIWKILNLARIFFFEFKFPGKNFLAPISIL